MALRPILEVCDKDTGYEGGGRRRGTWWRQTVARKQLSATLKYISPAAREWRWKSGRRGRGEGYRKVAELESDAGSDGPWNDGMESCDSQVGK